MSHGDLEHPGNLERALGSPLRGGSEAENTIVLLVTDFRNLRMAHNLLLNVRNLGLPRHLVVGRSDQVCIKLTARLPSSTCGFSSFLQRGSSADVDRALSAWTISDSSPHHLWWQRWRCMGRIVDLGFGALNLDADLSLRINPLPLLAHWRTLAQRDFQLYVSLDSDRGGRTHSSIFPAVNVGFVYCRGAAGSAAQWVLAEVARRASHTLLNMQPPHALPGKRGSIVLETLWEQEVFRDTLESAAFAPTDRHAMAHAERDLARRAAMARRVASARDWRRERLPLLGEAGPPQKTTWLPLRLPGTDVDDNGTEAAGGLPAWLVSQYLVVPHGNVRVGGWMQTGGASGVAVGHFVGQIPKAFEMRLLGWWNYAVDSQVSDASAPARLPHVLRRRRVLLLRRHTLTLHRRESVAPLQSAMIRFILLAFLAGRVAVLPLIPCSLPLDKSTLGMRDPNFWTILPLGDSTLCSGAARSLEWTLDAHPATWSATAARDARLTRRTEGCCQLIPHRCVSADASVSDEPVLNERDAGRLLAELRDYNAPQSTRRHSRVITLATVANASARTPLLILDAGAGAADAAAANSLLLDNAALPLTLLARAVANSERFRHLKRRQPRAARCFRGVSAWSG